MYTVCKQRQVNEFRRLQLGINFFHEAKTTVFYLNHKFLNAGMGVVLIVFFTIIFIYLKRQRVVHISGISKSINKETTIP